AGAGPLLVACSSPLVRVVPRGLWHATRLWASSFFHRIARMVVGIKPSGGRSLAGTSSRHRHGGCTDSAVRDLATMHVDPPAGRNGTELRFCKTVHPACMHGRGLGTSLIHIESAFDVCCACECVEDVLG